MRLELYRVPRETTQPGDLLARYEVGPLRCKFCGIRVPVFLVRWWLR